MSLLSFNKFLKSIPEKKVFLADTSFIIKSWNSRNEEHKVKNKLAGKAGFTYNVIIKKELLHVIRYQMMDDSISNEKIKVNKSINYIWTETAEHARLKCLCDSGYQLIFREVFGENGEKLKEEFEKTVTGFVYSDGKNNKNAKNWNNARAIMAMYGLDSSDAMILNFAIGDASIAGIITSDGDFRVCGDVEADNQFDIIMPENLSLRRSGASWKASENQ